MNPFMLFTSRRPNTTGGKIDAQINEPFEDIYVSTRRQGNGQRLLIWDPPINTDDHDANSGLSADGQNFDLYR